MAVIPAEKWSELEAAFPTAAIAADLYPLARRLSISERSCRLRWKQWRSNQDRATAATAPTDLETQNPVS
ncbi:hypothetical protein, partial [Morganella morganii]|uniref:hypothetical protein n=1 Tax=Morganella morganii TaxID=582 RepID=UPI003A874A20